MQPKIRLPRLTLAFLLLALLLFLLPGILRSWEQAAAPAPDTGSAAAPEQIFPLRRILLLPHTSLEPFHPGSPAWKNPPKPVLPGHCSHSGLRPDKASLRLVGAGDPPDHNSSKAPRPGCLLLRAEMDDRLYFRALPDTSLAEHPDTVLQHDTFSWLTAAWRHLVGQQPRANKPNSITNL